MNIGGGSSTCLAAPNLIGQAIICYGPSNLSSLVTIGHGIPLSMPSRRTKCFITIGANREQSIRLMWFNTLDLMKEGMKVIVIDPRRIPLAERATLWLQLRPGTDCALLMGMINIIISEGLYDKEFVDKWCYGFDKLAERAKEYPVDRVADITWVPAEKIVAAARMYATNKPAFIEHGVALDQLPGQIETINARLILTAITGNFDIRGGERLYAGHPQIRRQWDEEFNEMLSPEQKAKQIGADRFKLLSLSTWEMLREQAISKLPATHCPQAHGPLVYRAMITSSSNPMVTEANTKLVYKAIKSLELYVVHDYWMTPSAELADYVTPAANWLERPVIRTFDDAAPFVDVGEAALPNKVEGEYDRRRDYDLWRGLGIRLGQEKYWLFETLEEALNERLKPAGFDGIEDLIAKQGGGLRVRHEEKMYEKRGFGTPTGKVELYSTILEKLGYDPLPAYTEPGESPVSDPELAQQYPLILLTGSRHQPFYHSEHHQVDSLRKQHPQPLVQINPEAASELGIEDGDWVWIETPRGRVRMKCEYFEGIDPRVIHAEHGWWFPELPGEEPWLHGVWESNIDVVIDDDPDRCNQIYGGWSLRTALCKVYKVKNY